MAVANATLLVGAEASTDNVSNNPIDMADKILELEPDQAPFVTLAKRLKKVAATNPKYQWLESKSMPWLTTMSASATSAATAIGVVQDIFRVGDVVRITSTGEAILVTATAAGAITATRALGGGAGSAAGAINASASTSAQSGSELFIVSNSNAEGSTLREIKHPALDTQFNYTEIVRTPFGVTGTEDATKHYGGDERARLRAKFGIEHMRNLERMFWFGARSIQGTNQRTSGGVVEFLASNVTAGVGSLDESKLKTILKSAFRYGSGRKIAFVSPTVKLAMDGLVSAAKVQVNDPQGPTKYGVDLTTYYSSQGVLDIVQHRAWNDSAVYGGYGFIIDPEFVEYVYLQGRDTMLKPNVQAPDYDGVKDEYLTECGLKLANEAAHAKFVGVTG